MNKLFRLPLALALLLLAAVAGASALHAQEPVSTGVVQAIDPAKGVLTILSNQTRRPVTFVGMQQALLVHAQGKPVQLSDIRPGLPVTVQYAIRGEYWYVSKLIMTEAPTVDPTATTPVGDQANPAAAVSAATPMNVPGAINPTTSITDVDGRPAKEPANPALNSRGRTDPVPNNGAVPRRNRAGGNAQ